MPGLHICLLGAPRVEREGAPVVFERRKSLALLAYLAVERRAVGRDALATLLWPDLDQERSRADLRRTLVALQQGIGKGWLTLVGDQVALAEGPGLLVDIARFRTLLAGVAEHSHSPGRLCAACRDGLAEAAGLYRGDFLAGFTLTDTAEFDDWQTYQAESLRRELAGALEALALTLGSRGDYQVALNHAQRWLALDPLNEAAHRALMQLYAACGEQAAALRQYEQCVRVLSVELGITPEPETTALQAEIKSGRWERRPFGGQPAPDSLPPDLTPFIGRAAELAQLAAQLADPACRLLTVVGPGGMGKTRLAVQAARAQVERFDHGVCFIDLSAVLTPELLPEAILRALDVRPQGGNSASQQLLDYLRDRRLLLLLDNCEHLLEGAGLLVDLLRGAPHIKLLATSRARLNIYGEWLAPVEGLRLPGADGDHDLQAYDATALFLGCMRRLQPAYRPDQAEAAHIVRLCRLLDGVPLAIELAAGWAHALPVGQIADEIARDVAFLATPEYGVPARQRSMQATFDHSWRLLTARERSLLQQMSVFRGGFTRAAVQAVTGAEPHDLRGLVDASWLRLGSDGRYGIHELVRQYAGRQLTGGEQFDGAQPLEGTYEGADEARRHCMYYAEFLNIHAYRIWRGKHSVALIRPELGNLLAAWGWAVQAQDFEILARLARGLACAAEPTGWYRELLGAVEPVAADLQKRFAARGRDEQAAPGLPGNDEAAAAALAWMLFCERQCYGHLGPFERAMVCIGECLSLIPESPRSALWGELPLLIPTYQWFMPWVLGYSEECLRQLPGITARIRQAESRYGSHVGEFTIDDARSLCSAFRGVMLVQVGHYDEACGAFEERIAWAERSGSEGQKAGIMTSYVDCLWAMGEYARGEAMAREVIQILQRYGDRLGIAFGHLCLGSLANATGNHEMAHAFCRRALTVFRQVGESRSVSGSLKELGTTELALGHPTEANRHFAEAWDSCVRAGMAGTVAQVGILLGLGHAALALHDPNRAQEYYRQALSGPTPAAWETADALRGLSGVLLLKGQSEAGARLLALVINSPLTAQPIRALAEKTFQEITPQLSAEQLAAVVHWGPGRDVQSVVDEFLALAPRSAVTV